MRGGRGFGEGGRGGGEWMHFGFRLRERASELWGKLLQCGYMQWCSLVFCSEYTVIFFLPSLILIRTRAASHTTTLAKQGSTLTIIFRSTCAANKKIIIWVTVKKFWSTFSITKMCLPITKYYWTPQSDLQGHFNLTLFEVLPFMSNFKSVF